MLPKKVDRYEIRSQIGGNERGAVYQALDTETNRDVALKLLAGQSLFTLTTQKKFAQQMTVLQGLSHPAMLPLIAFGAEDNRPFIVMPLMTGNLAARITASPFDVQEALRICGRIGDALDFAASNNQFHLDLKPNNILFDNQGQPFLADLGLVQVINSLSAANPPQVNPFYMSPEQVRRRRLTAPAHVYSLAAILFHMLTGQTLFTGASDLVASFKHTSEAPRSIRTLRSELTRSFDAVMNRALQKRPEDRYPSCRTFIQQLIGAQGGSISPDEVRSADFTAAPPQQAARAPQMRSPQIRRPQAAPQGIPQLTPQQAEELRNRVRRVMLAMGVGLSLCIALIVFLGLLLGQ